MVPRMKSVIEYAIPPVILDCARAARALVTTARFRPAVRGNSVWKDRYPGELVYVLGNGPSLAALDRTVLRGKKVVVMNSFDRALWKHEVDIVAHCIGEPRNTTSWSREEILANIAGTNSQSYWLHFSSLGNLGGVPNGKAIHYVLPAIEPGIWGVRPFALHCSTLGYATTAQLAIQVALYMGFKKVVLLGFDHDWMASRDYSRHFYSVEKDSSDHLAELSYSQVINFMQRMWSVYYRIKLVAERSGATIRNATPGSYLDVFENEPI
jgi:uncharacterized Rossmann fold enzyme